MAFLLQNCPSGCKVIVDKGRVVAYVTSIRYSTSAWIGNLLVLPAYRRMGIGRRLIGHILSRLDSVNCRTVWLTASSDGAHLYRTMGFREIDRIQRWSRFGTICPGIDSNRFSSEAIQIDCQGWGDNRSAIFTEGITDFCWQVPGGFLACSALHEGWQLGPWGAVSTETAERLFDSLPVLKASIEKTVLDVPERNLKAAETLSARGFAVTGTTLLMYRGVRPLYRPENIFGLASLGSYG